MNNDNFKNNYTLHEIPKKSYAKYSIMLLEELYNRLGIRTYHNDFVSLGDSELTYFKKPQDSYTIKPANYLMTYLKIKDENEGKVARDNYDVNLSYNMNTLKEVLSKYLCGHKYQEILEQLYTMFGVSALTSSNCDSITDWELLLDKNNLGDISFVAKSHKTNLCNFDVLYDYLNGNEKIDRNYSTKLKGIKYEASKKLYEFILNALDDYDISYPIVKSLCSIAPEEIIEEVERTRGVLIPSECINWFVSTINKNIIILNDKFLNINENKHYSRQ